MGNFHHKALMVSASVSAYTAPALMTVCLLTDHWIYGKQTRLSTNPVVKAGDTRSYNFTYHQIGLWRECIKEKIDAPYDCKIVKYSKTEAKLEKGFKAVSYRSAPSMACFTAASVLLIIAIVLFTRGLCKRRRKAVFFISGLLFSISGLLTMVGVTLYVSITTEESVKIDQGLPVMKSLYGYSFLCAVLSFVLQELTGVLTVYWFIYRFRALVRKQEKLRERTRQLMGNCLSMTTALPLNLASFVPTSNMNNNNNVNSYDYRSQHSQSNQNHYSTSNNVRYQYVIGDGTSRPSNRSLPPPSSVNQQRRRLPFDRSSPMLQNPQNQPVDKFYPPPRSPTLPYGDYCRVLIRAEDMDLLTHMVKSKSQAQLLANSRPTTPAPTSTISVKPIGNNYSCPSPPPPPPPPPTTITTRSMHPDSSTRRSIRKGVKRTTSV